MKSKVQLVDPLETVHQERVVAWLDSRTVNGRPIRFFAVPNHNALMSVLPKYRQMQLKKKLYNQGVRGGVPDIIILTKNPLTGKPVALEMKRIVASKHALPCSCLDVNQVEWKRYVQEEGMSYILAHGYKDAIETLIKLGY